MRFLGLNSGIGFLIYTMFCFFANSSHAEFPDKVSQIYKSQKTCGSAFFSDENYFVSSQMPTGILADTIYVSYLTSRDSDYLISIQDQAVQVIVNKNILYILGRVSIQAYDLDKRSRIFNYSTHPFVTAKSNWREVASGFIVVDDIAYISHGVKGFVVLDLKTGKFKKLIQMPTISAAMDIAKVDENHALAVVDNNDDSEFRGLYWLNLKTLEVEKKMKVDNALPLGVSFKQPDSIYITYLNSIWKISLKEALKSSEPSILRRAWKFQGQEVNIHSRSSFDEQNAYLCVDEFNNTLGVNIPVPKVFSLKELKL